MRKTKLPSDEKDLQHQFNEGCYEAFAEVYRNYWEHFYNYVFRLCQSEAKTEDILQDVFADLWELRGTLGHVHSLRAYVFAMVKSKTLKMLYREKRIPQEQIDLLADQLRQSEWGTLDNLMAEEIESAISSTVKTMPARMQQTFVKSRYEGYSRKEISEEMGVSDQTVKKQLQHSLRLIKTRLSRLYTYFF